MPSPTIPQGERLDQALARAQNHSVSVECCSLQCLGQVTKELSRLGYAASAASTALRWLNDPMDCLSPNLPRFLRIGCSVARSNDFWNAVKIPANTALFLRTHPEPEIPPAAAVLKLGFTLPLPLWCLPSESPCRQRAWPGLLPRRYQYRSPTPRPCDAWRMTSGFPNSRRSVRGTRNASSTPVKVIAGLSICP